MRTNTASVSRGRVAPTHNTREYVTDRAHCPDHIHYDRIKDNLVLINEPIRNAYDRLFGDALDAYNAKQTRADRRIDSYLDHVRTDKKLHDAYEFVVQVGNMDDPLDGNEAKEIYAKWLSEFVGRYNKNFDVIQAVVHLDEATPHMHVEFVPVATATRGLAVQNSFSRALKQAGEKDFVGFQAHMCQMLGDVMAEHGIERVAGDKDRQMDGVDINVYKRTLAWEKEQKAQVNDELTKARKELSKAKSATTRELMRIDGIRAEFASEEATFEQRVFDIQTTEAELAYRKQALDGREAKVVRKEKSLTAKAKELDRRERDVKRLEKDVSELADEKDTLTEEVGELARKKRDLQWEVNWWQTKLQDVVKAFGELTSLVEAIVRLPFDAKGFLDGLRAAVSRPEFAKALSDAGHLHLPSKTAQRAAESLRGEVYHQGTDLLSKVREINEMKKAKGLDGHDGRGGKGDDPLGL